MSANQPFLSIIIPTFNEVTTIQQVVDQVRSALNGSAIEIVIVDDGSTDGTTEVVNTLDDEQIICLFHRTNRGKGAALRTAFQRVKGQVIVIQDADLEYDPNDIPRLIQPILDDRADVVFGSRFHGPAQRIHLFWHRLANHWLSTFSNVLNNLDLSDMETGYKAFRRSALEGIVIRENRFGVEPELTAKFAKRDCRIYEVPISYHGRDYSQGKKIGFRDALRAVWCIVRYRVAD